MPSARNRAAAALAACLILGACLMLGGCADYMANRDSVTLGLGDAPQANIGIQTINPFPPEASNTDIDGDGRVVARAQRLYAPRGAAAATPPPEASMTGVSTTTN